MHTLWRLSLFNMTYQIRILCMTYIASNKGNLAEKNVFVGRHYLYWCYVIELVELKIVNRKHLQSTSHAQTNSSFIMFVHEKWSNISRFWWSSVEWKSNEIKKITLKVMDENNKVALIPFKKIGVDIFSRLAKNMLYH